MKWMGFQCEAPFVAESPLGYQHFFQVVCGCPKGLLDAENFGKLYLSFFPTVFAENSKSRKPEFRTGGMWQRAIDARRR